MRNGRHAHFSRRRSHRPIALIVSLVLVMCLAIGGTVAYLVTKTDAVNNTFTPTDVSCEVVKNADGSVQVQNTGSINAYIRVYVTANYVKSNGHICAAHTASATAPILNGTGWSKGEDGLYYYSAQVPSNGLTSVLFSSPPTGANAECCTLEIEVFASAIQPGTAAGNAWRGEAGS